MCYVETACSGIFRDFYLSKNMTIKVCLTFLEILNFMTKMWLLTPQKERNDTMRRLRIGKIVMDLFRMKKCPWILYIVLVPNNIGTQLSLIIIYINRRVTCFLNPKINFLRLAFQLYCVLRSQYSFSLVWFRFFFVYNCSQYAETGYYPKKVNGF